MSNKLQYKSDNKNLSGILNKVNDSNSIAIICHARTSSKDSRPTTKLGEELTKNNINNFRFDFVSCGDSEGDYTDYTVTNMVKNLRDTIEYLKDNYGYDEFVLIGCSMGGRIISLVDKEKYNIKQLVLWYPALDYGRGIINLPGKKEKIAQKQGYYEIEKNAKLSYEYFYDERKYRAYKNLYNTDVPKLFIHGTKDPYVDYRESVKVSKKCPNSKLVLIENADHGFHNEEHMNEAINETLNFIKRRDLIDDMKINQSNEGSSKEDENIIKKLLIFYENNRNDLSSYQSQKEKKTKNKKDI